jgi:hypothetical protein
VVEVEAVVVVAVLVPEESMGALCVSYRVGLIGVCHIEEMGLIVMRQ